MKKNAGFSEKHPIFSSFSKDFHEKPPAAALCPHRPPPGQKFFVEIFAGKILYSARKWRILSLPEKGAPPGGGPLHHLTRRVKQHMEKILIIDDSPLQAAQLQAILKGSYDITISQTAEDGLRRASTETFSLILLDVVMPGMDGFTLLKKLQEEIITQSIPVILITSLSDIEDEQYGLTLGAVDYITKPFSPLIVEARVNTHIKLYNYRKQVELQSRTDQLTGIANRRQHDHYSVVKWSEAARLQVPFSVCMFDIDHFKVFNDTFGHPAGDRAIAAVAKTAAAYLQRTTDFMARYGGEEFVAFLMGDRSDQAFAHLKKIRQAIEDLHIPHDPSVSKWVTVSIGGVTVVPRSDSSYASYLKIADTMLYDAKKFGRNRVVWADEKAKQLLEK